MRTLTWPRTGAGADPSRGARAAAESRPAIAEAVAGAEMVFITACLGGGTGTGAAPIVAEVAREMGALTIGVATKPFSFEGARRRDQAEEGARQLEETVDTLIVIPNDRLLELGGGALSILESFGRADDVLRQGIQGLRGGRFPGSVPGECRKIAVALPPSKRHGREP